MAKEVTMMVVELNRAYSKREKYIFIEFSLMLSSLGEREAMRRAGVANFCIDLASWSAAKQLIHCSLLTYYALTQSQMNISDSDNNGIAFISARIVRFHSPLIGEMN